MSPKPGGIVGFGHPAGTPARACDRGGWDPVTPAYAFLMDPRRAALLTLAGVLGATGIARFSDPLGKPLALASAVLFFFLIVLPGGWGRKTKGRIKRWLRSKGRWWHTVECDPNKHRFRTRDYCRSEDPIGLYPEGRTERSCPQCGWTEGFTDVGRPAPANLAARLAQRLGYGM